MPIGWLELGQQDREATIGIVVAGLGVARRVSGVDLDAGVVERAGDVDQSAVGALVIVGASREAGDQSAPDAYVLAPAER